jgi:hypothetical protein
MTHVRQVPANGETGRASEPGGGSQDPFVCGRAPFHLRSDPSVFA